MQELLKYLEVADLDLREELVLKTAILAERCTFLRDLIVVKKNKHLSKNQMPSCK